MAVPHTMELLMPALGALSRSGGSGTFAEIFSAASERIGLTESDLQQTFPRTGKKMAKSRVDNALRELKMAGCVDYSRDNWMWSLTEAGRVAWAEAEGGPEAAQEIASRVRAQVTKLRAEERRARQERKNAQRIGKSG